MTYVSAAEARRGELPRDPRLTSRQAAQAAGVRTRRMQRWAREGRVPYQRDTSGRLRFHPTDVEALRLKLTREPRP